MNQHIKEFNALIAQASHYLSNQLSYAPSTVGEYRKIWKDIRTYMADHQLTHYDQAVEDQVLHHHFGKRSVRELSVNEKRTYNGLKMLRSCFKTYRSLRAN